MDDKPYMTHYEYTRMRGIRLQQLEDGMPPFVEVEPMDTFAEIFQKEVEANLLPFVFVRTHNKDTQVEIHAEQMRITADTKM